MEKVNEKLNIFSVFFDNKFGFNSSWFEEKNISLKTLIMEKNKKGQIKVKTLDRIFLWIFFLI